MSKRYLNGADVTRYARWKATANRLEEKIKPLHDKLIRLLEKGYACPLSGPWLVELQEALANINWEAELLACLTREHGPAKANSLLEEIRKAAPRAKYAKLIKKVNPQYKLRRAD